MKKILSLVIAVALVLGAFCTFFAAAEGDQFTATADKTEVNPGDEVTITVTVNNVEIKSLGVGAGLSEGLTFVSGKLVKKGYELPDPDDEEEVIEPVLKTNMGTKEDGSIEPAALAYEDAHVLNGNIVTLKVTVDEGATGTLTVTVKIAANDGDIALDIPVELTVAGSEEPSEPAEESSEEPSEPAEESSEEPGEPETGKYPIETFAGYASGDISIVVRQGEKITIGDVTGKDYNYYRVILVDAEGKVVEILENLGRAEEPHSEGDGRKDLVEIPEGGFAIGINNDAIVADGSVYAELFGEDGVKVGDTITLAAIDTADLEQTAAGTALPAGGFDWTPAPVEPEPQESEPEPQESEPEPQESEPEPQESENEGEQSDDNGNQGGNDNPPDNGDAGLIALAIVSVLAIGGAVIVKKSK
ncbi:MAG: hypothetical protein J5760_03230 [Clostridia bacterium]|nr:hypothetical protein [Clostridia bacterium]